MTLVLGEETGRIGTTTSGSTAPEDVRNFLLPWCLHVVNVLDLLVGGVPSVGVTLGRLEVVVGWDEDVRVSVTLGRREHWVESVDSTPVGEEVALVVMCPWVCTEVKVVVDSLGKGKVLPDVVSGDTSIGQSGNRDLSLVELSAQGAKETARLGGWRTSTAVSLPDIAVSLPVGNELATKDVFNALCRLARLCKTGLTGSIGSQVLVQPLLPWNQDTTFSLLIDWEVHIRQVPLELFQHDTETLGTSTDFRVLKALANIDGAGLAVLDTDQVDRWQVTNIDAALADLLSRQLPEWLEVTHKLVVLVNHDSVVGLGKLEPDVKALGWVPLVPATVLLDSRAQILGLPCDLFLKLFARISHELWNGVVDRWTRVLCLCAKELAAEHRRRSSRPALRRG